MCLSCRQFSIKLELMNNVALWLKTFPSFRYFERKMALHVRFHVTVLMSSNIKWSVVIYWAALIAHWVCRYEINLNISNGNIFFTVAFKSLSNICESAVNEYIATGKSLSLLSQFIFLSILFIRFVSLILIWSPDMQIHMCSGGGNAVWILIPKYASRIVLEQAK